MVLEHVNPCDLFDKMMFLFDELKLPAVVPDDFEIRQFRQWWGSSALGFHNLVGLSALTEATTTVFILGAGVAPTGHTCEHARAFVFFDHQFAYRCPLSDSFLVAMEQHTVADTQGYSKYFDDYQAEFGLDNLETD